jgi:16S rRNA (cytidine1402-2'-O)-methyltransferase
VAVRLSHRLGLRVAPLVGPSSILLALMGSGFSGQSFAFHGYLPIDKAERAKAVRHLEKEAQQRDQTQIFMETPYRNNALLEELLRTCGPNTPLCIACQLTAPDQFIKTMTVREWQGQPPDLHKKPTVFLLYRA